MAKTTGLFGGFYFDEDVFGEYISERDPINSKLISSGVITSAPKKVSEQLKTANNIITIPFYVPFAGDPQNYDGKTDIVPKTLSGKKLSAMAYRRMNGWLEDDFTRELTGTNDLANVASSIGVYQAVHNQKAMLSILKGLEGVSAFASHVNDVAVDTNVEVVDANRLTSDLGMVAMQQALGDHMQELQIWFMHSAVYLDLVRQGFANDVTIKYGTQREDPFMGNFLGLPVIIDDSMTLDVNTTSTKNEYHTYLMGTGAFMTCPVRIDVPNEITRDALKNGGQTTLSSKWGRLLHPYGFSFDGASIVEESPLNTEFSDSTKWTMKYDTKNIPIVAFITNVK